MKKDEEGLRSHFPVKKCLIATLVIILVAFLVLTLLYSLANSGGKNDKYWIFLLVWGVVFSLLILVYWLIQIVEYRRKRNDEK